MNFLAHIYLSGENNQIKIGNFIADAIRGNNYKGYATTIQKGIFFHRKIDTFTDSHATVKISKRRLHERYRHYDGVIIDVLYDHFLAKNWASYSQLPLDEYAQEFYSLLNSNFDILPEKVQNFLPYMIKDDWLNNYRTIEGIEKVLIGLNKRTKNKSQMYLAIEDLKLHYTEFDNDFTTFFKDLQQFCLEELKTITT
ncbi:MAG TPA: DUF479 domain-containing protein [Flavobacteriaceae bacterium]|nr:DUF479 domain-containing protein [Flavobacteriaceae bacterium]